MLSILKVVFLTCLFCSNFDDNTVQLLTLRLTMIVLHINVLLCNNSISSYVISQIIFDAQCRLSESMNVVLSAWKIFRREENDWQAFPSPTADVKRIMDQW
jgi:hypothetical protein